VGSPAYWNHVAQGLIPDAGGQSLAVHPTSLYLGLASLAAALASHFSRRRLRRSGSVTLLFILVLSGLRLLIEPLRETRLIGEVPGQTAIDLGLLLVCLPWLLGREWRAGSR
jgi:prolipoprotein diacylglyceryltransferase